MEENGAREQMGGVGAGVINEENEEILRQCVSGVESAQA